MELGEFLGFGWLARSTGNTGIHQAREDIGTHLGWDDGWYAAEPGLQNLFTFLNSDSRLLAGDGTRQDLLNQLTEAADDDGRTQWLTSVEREAFWSSPQNRYSAPGWDEAYGLSYRYDQLFEVYEWEYPPGSTIWVSQEEADAQVAQAVPDGDEVMRGTGTPPAADTESQAPRTESKTPQQAADGLIEEIGLEAFAELIERLPEVASLPAEQRDLLLSQVTAERAAAAGLSNAQPG